MKVKRETNTDESGKLNLSKSYLDNFEKFYGKDKKVYIQCCINEETAVYLICKPKNKKIKDCKYYILLIPAIIRNYYGIDMFTKLKLTSNNGVLHIEIIKEA